MNAAPVEASTARTTPGLRINTSIASSTSSRRTTRTTAVNASRAIPDGVASPAARNPLSRTRHRWPRALPASALVLRPRSLDAYHSIVAVASSSLHPVAIVVVGESWKSMGSSTPAESHGGSGTASTVSMKEWLVLAMERGVRVFPRDWRKEHVFLTMPSRR